MSVFGSTFADQEIDLTGDIPVVIPHKPLTLAAGWATPNPDMAAASDSDYFRNPNFSFWRAAMDHIEHSVGNEWRSEEHTSELQSLMRISYAGFCLKKK